MSADARVADVAYSRYDGPRSGRLAAIWSLARWSSLRALGARRGWKAKVIPITLILLGFAPALVVLGLRALFGPTVFKGGLANALPYSDYTGTIGIVILVFSVVVTPELLCPDRRDGTLSLYFSTAISRGDYVVGKVLAALMPILLVTLVPPLILYAGNLLFAVHPVGYLGQARRRHPPHHRLGAPDRRLLRARRPGDLVAHRAAGVRRRRLPGVPGHPDDRSAACSPTR